MLFRGTGPAWGDTNLRELASVNVLRPLPGPHPASTGTPVQQSNCHPFRYDRWLWFHNGRWPLRDRQAGPRPRRRPGPVSIDRGSTDSEVMFFLALTFGLRDDPVAAVERIVGFVEATGRQHGVDNPIQMTIGTTDGERFFGFRYSSEGQSRTALLQHRRRDPSSHVSRERGLRAALGRDSASSVRAARRRRRGRSPVPSPAMASSRRVTTPSASSSRACRRAGERS